MNTAILKGLIICLLLTGCSEKPVKQWQLAVQGAYHATLSNDGKKLVLASIHHGGSLWDTTKNARLYNWNHHRDENTQILTTAISPDGNFALTAEERDLVLWSTQSGKAFWLWNAPDDIYDAALTNDGRFALLGLGNFRAVFFDIRNGGVIREFRHKGPVRSVSISDDGRTALTGSEDQTAQVWDINTGKSILTLRHENQIRLVEISQNGRIGLTDASLESAKIWNLETGKLIQELNTKRFNLSTARFIENGQKLITGTTNRKVHLWDTKTGKLINTWQLPRTSKKQYTSATVHDVAPAGKNILAVSSDGYLFLLKR